MKTLSITAMIALLLGVVIMAYAGMQLLQTKQIYQEGNVAYAALSDQVRKSGGPVVPLSPAPAAAALIEIPQLSIDFAALQMINQDAVAWLFSPDTVIDYPVMKADDYSYYLDHLPDGTQNANGTLFIDYNCAADFSDPLTVIYGHHMKSGKMFGSLKGYKNQSYYDEHPYMYLYTAEKNYRLELIYGCVIGAGHWRERAFMYAANIDSLLAYAAFNTTFEAKTAYKEGDRLVALSTCSYEFNDARYVVLGVLRSEY